MRLLDLARKDLAQILRDRRSAIFMVAMPIAFTAFMGMAFRWAGQADPRSDVGFISLDSDSLLAQSLQKLIDSSGQVRLRFYAPGDTARAEAFVRQGRLDALVIVPDGYTRTVMNGSDVPLTLVCQENTPDGQAARRAVEACASRLLSAVEAARMAREAQAQASGAGGLSLELERDLARAVAAWLHPGFEVSREMAAGAGSLQQRRVPTSFEQASPGILVQFAIMGLLNSAMVLVLERRNRALQRLLTTSVSRTAIIAGHSLAMFVIVFLQGLLLILVGQYLFGVHYLSAPVPVLLVMVCLTLWVTGLGMLIGGLATGQEQVTAWALVSMFVFSGLGGCWFPLEVTGGTFSKIGHLLPSAWAMDGFQNVIVRGLGLGSVLLPCGVMFAYALAFMALAVWRFRVE